LGGGGHIAAAGAKVDADLETTKKLVLAAAERELKRHGDLTGDAF
jgi:nanoRNase/pAp phosphatase (c-di-AMP/oligoRNAs hydrolase)